jgi:N-acetylmuramic acid 6-phosphate etherase
MNNINFDQFKKIASEFNLGNITTESFNSLTENLAGDCENNLTRAIENLKKVDVNALEIIKSKSDELYKIYLIIKSVRKNGNKIFLSGCGATGRLSLAIETLARTLGYEDVIGFMAGGDYALIKSVESFEDRMSYGARQLIDYGFKDGDTLLAITEGGETSFVIGSILEAIKISAVKPIFIYCNPNQELLGLERCRLVLNNEKILKLNLDVGPMALSGSTRMQATTVQMLAAGSVTLYNYTDPEEFKASYLQSIDTILNLDYSFLHKFIEEESRIYKEKEIVTYVSCENLAITVLTDTTERSPTFSLTPFEIKNSKEYCLCYLTVKNQSSSTQAWNALLKRTPRYLDWGQDFFYINLESIYAFDISEQSIERRSQYTKNNIFDLSYKKKIINFNLNGLNHDISLPRESLLTTHLCLKVLLNTMSTAIMGRLGRFESNIMTWVKPSNYKLIDRATRYAQKLLENKNIEYDTVLKCVIELSQDEESLYKKPIVLEVVNKLSKGL